MEDQHEGGRRPARRVPPARRGLARLGGRVGRTRLADHLAELVAALCEHLDAEETRVLPLMAQHIRRRSGRSSPSAGWSRSPRAMLLTGFGMMLYEGDPDALALEIAKLPAPLRPILPSWPAGLPPVRPPHPRDACTGSGHVLSRIAVRQGWCTGVARATVGSEQMNDRDSRRGRRAPRCSQPARHVHAR